MSDINLIIRYDDDGSIEVLAKETEDKLSESGKKAGKKAGKSFAKSIGKTNKGIGETLTNGFKGALTVATALSATVAAIGGATIFKGISAAVVQEDAVNRLAGALKSSGDFSQEALADFQNYASGLQKLTKVGDEVTLGQLALAKSFGATNDQAKEIVKTAADMAQAFGTDIETQVRQLSKTLGGYAGELGETQPALKNLTQEQLRNGEAIGILSKAYEGQATNALNTFGGATAQLSNAIGDTFEELGKLATQNPAIIRAVRGLTGVFEQAQVRILEFGKTFDIFDDLLFPLQEFNKAVIKYVVAPLELVGNIGVSVFKSLKTGIATIVAGFGVLGQAVVKVLETVGVDVEDSLKDSINNFADAAKETAVESGQELRDSFDKVFDFSISDKLDKKNDELRGFLQEQKQIILEEQKALVDESAAQTIENVSTISDQYASTWSILGSVASEALTGVGSDLKTMEKNLEQSNQMVKKFTKSTGQAFQRGFAGAVGGAFAEFGRALQQGNNALEAFGQAFLKAIGNTLIQQGTAFILEGTAYTFSANPALAAKGPGLIAAGGAMAAFGGILGASVSGGATGGGGGGTGGGGTTTFQDPVSGEFIGQVEGAAQPNTVLNINVEGNVVDQDAFTRRLVEQIGEEGGRQGLVFDNFATV